MNAPDVSPAIRAEAARSLLERLWEKTALVRFFRYNAAAKHGVPVDDREFTLAMPTQPAAAEPVAQQQQVAVPQQPVMAPVVRLQPEPKMFEATLQETDSRTSSPWKSALATLAVLAGLGSSVAVGYLLSGPNDVQQVEQQSQNQIYSPLQYIEDQGGHLP